jgi:CHAT domain-containing protein
MTYLFLRISSKYENTNIEHIPAATNEEPWAGLSLLRHSLVERGFFMEANALFRAELNRVPLKSRDSVIHGFLMSLSDLPSKRGRDYIEAVVRLQWATTYVQLSDMQRASEEFNQSAVAIHRWCNEFAVLDQSSVPHSVNLRYERLNLIDSDHEKLRAAKEFIADMERIGSGKAGLGISIATNSALALCQSTGNMEYLEEFFALHEKQRLFDESVSQDLCDLILNRMTLINITTAIELNTQNSLEWVDGFLLKYRYFQCPNELETLHIRRGILLRSLDRFEEAKGEDQKARYYADKGSTSSLGSWLNLSTKHILVPRTRSTEGNALREYESEDEDEKTHFFLPWRHIAGDQIKCREYIAELLIEWALEDTIAELIPFDSLQTMLGVSAIHRDKLLGGDGTRYIAEIKNQDRGAVESYFFPPDKSSETPQDNRCNLVTGWLRNFPKGQRNKRLFCLHMLREQRQFHFGDLEAWDLQIVEINFLLDLYPTLPEVIRELCRASKGLMLAQLGNIYNVILQRKAELDDPVIYQRMLDAESYCQESIGELEKNSQTMQVAIQHRNLASICLLRIRREERLLKAKEDHAKTDNITENTLPNLDVDTALESIKNLRRMGLEHAAAADKIITSKELNASLMDGVQGVDERLKVSKYHSSFWTVHLAVRLLLTAHPKLSDEDVKQLWAWVQRYKARALSRTMGTRKQDPRNLVDQIKSSPELDLQYQELLRLEKLVEATSMEDRFNIRQHLHKHQDTMKKDPLLRQIVDIREGTPLELFEIAALEADARSSIVLVDWFYLEPVYPGETGTLLLMTARATSKVTLDILSTMMDDVNDWRLQYLATVKKLKRSTARREFDFLDGLIKPLIRHTTPEDVLVLCPSHVLPRLPLHALPLQENQLLIQRNAVVYSHSHSLLRSCFYATERARHSPDALNPLFLAGISRIDELVHKDNKIGDYRAGRKWIRELSKSFNASPLLDEDGSKTKFKDQAKTSRLLHFHTHCGWNSKDPLDHSLAFPELDPQDVANKPQDYRLTAREVFDIRLQPGTHVNMIACQGGLTDLQMGDEVMGLVPALFYSGASSTVSTLWSIDDPDGVDFSKSFFRALITQCICHHKENGHHDSVYSIDLARALQTAINELYTSGNTGVRRHHEQSLFRWASFVMHGYWRLPLSRHDIEWLATEVHLRSGDYVKVDVVEGQDSQTKLADNVV